MEAKFTKAIDILYLAKQHDVEITLDGDQLQLKIPKGKTIDKELLGKLGANKQLIIDFLKDDATAINNNTSEISPFDRSVVTRVPLSFSQERLWFIDRLQGSVQYHLPSVLRIKGNIDVPSLSNALQEIVSRHEILRTVYREEDGQVYQLVKPPGKWSLRESDGTKYQEKELERYIQELIQGPFDLSKDDMLRAELISTGPDGYLLVVTMHHIAADAFSIPVMVREVAVLYNAFITGGSASLPELGLQYADYAVWQRAHINGDFLEEKLKYWKTKLDDVSLLALPTDNKRSSDGVTRGAGMVFDIGADLSLQVQELAQNQGATLYMTMLAAFKVLLYRYSGQEDICVGTSVANRSEQELDGLIGFFVNTLALRDNVKSEMSFTELLRKVKTTMLEAYDHQEVPFERIVDAVVKERQVGVSPLFQVMLVLINTSEASELKLGELSFTTENFEQTTTKFDLTFFITENKAGLLRGSVQYNTGLYSESRIQKMAQHFKELLTSIVTNPETQVGKLEILTKEEKQELKTFEESKVSYPKDKTIAQLFEEQAKTNPDSIAVAFEEQQLSYKALNERANQLAHYLQSKGVKENTLVPLLTERGPDMLTGILGILKAGGAYVPVDTDFPQDRITYMLEDTKATVVVTTSTVSHKLPQNTGITIIALDEEKAALRQQPITPPNTDHGPNHLAYIIYTSGSTGKPKGVEISHSNIADYVYGLEERIKLSESKSFALVSSIATDLGNTVLYGSLLTGGTLHVFSKETVSHIEAIHEYFDKNEIDCLKIVPSHWKALTLDNQPLLPKKQLIFGGEALQRTIVETIQATQTTTRIVNHYGPTETTIGKLVHEVDKTKEYGPTIPIGKPFSNTKTYVLSKELTSTPIGVPGQLYIAGDGLAKGYLNNPELTKEKFISHPTTKERLYATGDKVQYEQDGNITFIGRVDDQVKIRGYRVEPGEIGRILEQSEQVKQAIVLARDDKQGNKQLIGYIVANDNYDKQELQDYLKEQLPDYMIPAHITELTAFPLTANGKIDRRALPDPEATQTEQYTIPQNETEAKLKAIWEEVLEEEDISTTADFFELGGHSLLAVRLISMIRKQFGMELPISEVFDYPTVEKLSTRLTNEASTDILPPVTAETPRPEYIPLSFSQERLWFIDRLEGSAQYHIPTVLRLKGALNKEILEKTLKSVISRHEVLRTTILEHEGHGYQYILPADNWKLTITAAPNKDEAALSKYVAEQISKPFDLSKDYMLRAELINIEDNDYILVATMHHIVSDGWSRSILVKEVTTLYEGYTGSVERDLPALPVQYADYAIWQRKYMQGEVLENKLAYWKGKLENPTPLQLPTDYSRPSVQSSRGASYGFKIEKQLATQLQALSQAHGATLYMTLLSAFKVLLYRYSGREDIVAGSPIIGRSQQELEGLIGFFVNTIALRSHLSGDKPFTQLLEEVKATTLEAYAHQEVPFEKVVDAVVKDRDMSRSPLFQVMFSLQNTPEVPELKLGGLQLSAAGQKATTAKFDIAFMMNESSTGIYGAVEYSTDLYKAETIGQMVSHYMALLESVTQSADQQIGSLSMLTASEEKTLLHDFNDTALAYPKEKNIVSRFESQAAKSPEAPAIIFEKEQLTYSALNERSNQLANHLIKQRVKAETLVPICVERSPDMVIGILAILKAGGAYVPIDPEYPQDRITYMLEDTGAKLVITNSTVSNKIPKATNLEIIELDKDKATLRKQSTANPATKHEPQNLAYVIYTSGSTGRPKGVMIEHRSLMNLISWHNKDYEVSQTSKATSMAGVGFDAFGWEIWPYLSQGASVLVINDETRLSAPALAELFITKQITHSFISTALVPDFIEATRDKPNSLKYLLTGGDKLSVVNLAGINYTLVNNYGPTENTVVATSCIVSQENKTPPIGKPVSNTRIYLLSTDNALSPIGVSGEICIGGASLARGYLNNPALTQEKFIKDPFSNEPNARIYKTGDLGRWLPDGNIEYQGRIDDQVKIRGYRIELGEIETTLNQSGLITQSVMLAKEDNNGIKRLVGYVAAKEFDKQKVQQYLSTKLPDYMVPAIWVELESIPLTQNGKIDRRALPDPELTDMATAHVAPRNEMEQKLAAIWKELLKVDRVGIHDNFFELGGHSLLVMRVVSAIRSELNIEISIKDLFVHSTIESLGAHLDQQFTGSLLPAILAGERPEYIPLSFSQERLWFIDRLEGSVQYHLPAVLRLRGNLKREVLEDTLRAVISRHEVLRTVIMEHDGRAFQQIMEPDRWSLGFIEEPAHKEAEDISSDITGLISRPFDLSVDYMLRADLLKLSTDDYILVVTVHHIASDGWSTSILVTEVAALYAGYETDAKTLLPGLPIQYADYAIWQRKYVNGEFLEEGLGYWKRRLLDVLPLQLPADFSRPSVQSTRGTTVNFKLDHGLSVDLVELSRRQGATLFMTLLTAFKTLLYRYSGQEDICVGTPIAGRSHKEIEQLIGFFINTLALRSNINGDTSFIELLEEIKTTTLEAYAHQEVPFEKVVDAVVKERDMSRSPLFQVWFVFQNTPEVPELKLGELSLTAERQKNSTSKFDISLYIWETVSGIQGTVEYCTDLYKAETIDRFVSHYINLLGSIVSAPQNAVGSLKLLSNAEENALNQFNDTSTGYSDKNNIVTLFETQAIKSPEAPAIIFEKEQLTYSALNERSNQLANHLIKQGVKAETLVPICVERGPEMVIGILAILKAGGAYVPIDPEYPQDRISYMLEDTGAKLVITNSTVSNKIPAAANLEIIELDKDKATLRKQSTANPATYHEPGDLAYVIYTSGSTGRPKGVQIEHRSANAFIAWCQSEFSKSKFDIVYATTSICFDLSVFELFYPLSTGKPIRILENGLAIPNYLATDNAVLINTVPSVVESLLNEKTDLGRISVINMAGEPIPSSVSARLDMNHTEVRNLYGPTEDTTYSTNYKLEQGKPVLIGKPIGNTQIHILSRDNELTPIGVSGEICISGAGLARGYLNQPELTTEKFIKDPFSPNARLYKTGDLGRWLPDGNIEYQGRIDDQVKIRGYRIELGEIETILNQSGLITQSVVLAKADSKGTKRLVGYVVADHFDKQKIQQYLGEKLPDYMVPAIWVELTTIPLTPNGKTDKKALPDPEMADISTEYAAPRNETEQKLASIWQELLGKEQAGIYDNFFELGGDSILTIQVVSRMRRSGYTIQPKDIFKYQTIAGLSAAIGQGLEIKVSGEQGMLSGSFGLVPIQSWYLEKEQAAISHFNQSVLLKIKKDITPALLQAALDQLMIHHDALRLTFQKKAGQWEQSYGTANVQLSIDDLQATAAAKLPEQITASADKHQRSLSIEKGPLVRMALMQTPQSETANRLFIVIHHLAVDGVSWRIILEDLEALLSTLIKGEQPSATVKGSSYRQWQAALVNYSISRRLIAQKAYWEQMADSYQSLPEDKAYSGEVLMKDMHDHQVRLGSEQTRRLVQDVPKVYHTEINDLLLGALSATLCKWSGQDKIIIGLEGHGREDISQQTDINGTVGWFTSLYPVLLEKGGDSDSLIKGTKEALRRIPDKGLGYGVLKYITKTESLQGSDPWDIIFNYLGQIDTAIAAGSWLAAAGESRGPAASEEQISASKLSVNSSISWGELILRWNYSSKHYNADTVIKLAEEYINQLNVLIGWCTEQDESTITYTPSDYGLGAEITWHELDHFLKEPYGDKQVKDEIAGLYRLSGLQQGMLFHGLYDTSGSYIEQFVCDLVEVNREALLTSWSTVIKRHSILRSAFYYESFSIPVQGVFRNAELPLEELDYSRMDADSQQASLIAYQAADIAKGFDFKSAPLMRLGLIRLDKNRHRMIWTSHHILFDGWSLAILMEEFLNTYELVVSDLDLPSAEEDRYEDYIRYLEARDKDAEEQYWRQYLQGISEGTLLPFVRNTTERTKGKGRYGSESLLLDPAATVRVQKYVQSHRLTVNSLMQGVWALLLHKYTGNNEIIYGAVVSGRPAELSNVEQRVGMYINTLAFKAHFDENQETVPWFQGLQADQVASRQYQYTALHDVQEWVGIQGDLFDSLLVFENYPVSKLVESGSWSLQIGKVEVAEQTNYPLTVTIGSSDKLSITFNYNTDLLEQAYVIAMRDHFDYVLQQIVDGKANTLDDIKLSTAAQEQIILENFNATAADYPKNKSVVELFRERAINSPAAVAVVFEDKELTYRELDSRSNQLARYLQNKGVRSEELVPICIERGPDMVVGVLGIMKAGAAYVPIDPDLPADRISYMLEDTGATIVLSSVKSRSQVGESVSIIEIDGDRGQIGIESSSDISEMPKPGQLAYVIYTSGSTGKPKGVMIEHRSLVNLLISITHEVDFTIESKFLSVTTYSFDICYLELYVPLINGAKLVIVSRETASDGYRLKESIATYAPTHMQATPSTWQLLQDADWTNEGRVKMLIGGEAVKENVKEYLTGIGEVWNVYGPTETTIWSAIKKLAATEKVCIGKPLANTLIYIINKDSKLNPVGVTGEICIGGDGLARGYWNRAELTAEKFIKDPFSREPGARLYKTGDLGRWMPDGNLECLGRIDDQVKIRGYRIELGEIENVLNQLEPVQSSCVVVRQRDEVPEGLISYLILAEDAIKKAEHDLYSVQVNSWKEIYESEYSLEDEQEIEDPEFNVLIWKDSFTGKAIPEEQMREWQKDIIEVILAERPKNVLEIGSGTGLIYYPLAGKVKKYIGTDISKHSINRINERINKGLRNYGVTEFVVSAAHDISLAEDEQLDTIIINSVVQYFPGADYLTSVIEKSISLLNGNGRIVLGDIRDKRLLELFKTRLQLDKAESTEDIKEFKWTVAQEVLKEEELCFAPEYFYNLQLRYPDITHVEIKWKKGAYHNELTLYRYTVIIYVGVEKETFTPLWQSWGKQDQKQNIFDGLKHGHDIIAITDAPNPRLWQEKQLFEALQQNTVNTTGEFSSSIVQKNKESKEIEDILNDATENGYQYRLLLDEDPFKVNILLEKTPGENFIKSIYSDKNAFSNSSYTNVPLFADISQVIQKDIRRQLQQLLPDYMVPSEMIALQQLPLNSNGKIDRKFLSQRKTGIAVNKLNYQPPRNETEEKLSRIWQELLKAERVGIHDNFFEMGGHSLLAMRVISAIRRELNLELSIKDLFAYPTIALLIDRLNLQDGGIMIPAIEVFNPRPDHIPLSFSQERLWFIDRLEGSVQYHMPVVLRLRGELKLEILERTLRAVVNRHEVLRTVILEHDGQGYQQILAADNWTLGISKKRATDEDGLSGFISGLISKPFDLSRDYMLRADLIRLDKDEHVLVATIHHIASDGWSVSILVKEIVALYQGYESNVETSLPELSIQYADYAIWQRNYLQDEILENKIAYWKEKLEGVAPLQLPTDYTRPAIQSSRGATQNFKIDKILSSRLKALGNQQGATLYMTLLSAFKVLLYRYSGQEDICVGTPVAGRNQHEVEGLIGFFINTLALRSHVSGDMSFSSLLEDVKFTTLEAYSHQEIPFEKVVDAVVKERDMSRNPLFQVLFSLQNMPEVPELKLGGLSLSAESRERTTTQFDISFLITETNSGLHGTVEYNTDLYADGTIKQMISHYINLLGSIVVSPVNTLGSLGMLTDREQDKLLREFNRTHADYPQNKTIVTLFEEQVAKNPASTAVVFKDRKLTYGELNERSNQLAHYLAKKGVTAETLVLICIERSLEMIVGILGILKAGGVYVPVDPDYPQDRINYVLEDTAAEIVLSSASGRKNLPADKVQIIELDGDWELISREVSSNIDAKPLPGQLAYIIYTSGSTGKPKGAMIEHYNVVRLFKTEPCLYDFNDKDVWTMFHSFCFDFTVWEMYGALFYGGKLIIVPKEATRDISLFAELLVREQVTVLNQTPSAFYNLQDVFSEKSIETTSIRYVIFGGEALNPGKLRYWKQSYQNCRLINMYGITETTVHVTYQEIEWQHIQAGQSIIGKPIPTLNGYILNHDRNLVPVGVAGELYIGGAGLARGYLNRPELTAEKFVKDPFSNTPDARLYRTGDLARWSSDGDIEYLGRIDDQVKIRGYRIELGEIDSVLNRSELVDQGVVLVKTGNDGSKRLVGYVVAAGQFDKQKIQAYLSSKLPEYMVPALWVALDAIPLTANGKIDRRALPDPELADMAAEYTAPRNETEQKLATIWQELLGIEQAGIHDNFFELGGHSLLAMRVASAIRKELDIEVAIKELFINPTIAGLAEHLDEQTKGSLIPAIMPAERPEHIPLSFSQERLWFIDRLEGSKQYHLPAVLRLKGELKQDILENTIRAIVNRHEVLRTVIGEQGGKGYQIIMPVDNWALKVTATLVQDEPGLSGLIADLVGKPFDLSADYMLRADLIKLDHQEHILVVTMHHIASDGWSASILVKEVVAIYEACLTGQDARLPLLPVQYADYAIWQRKYMQGGVLEQKLQYWKTKLENVNPLQLPVDYDRPVVQSSNGATHKFRLEKDLSSRLQILSNEHGASLYMTLLAVFNILLYRYSGQEDISVGTPVAGRNQQELEGMIGFFINTLVLRTEVAGNKPFIQLLEEVKATTLEAYAHQEVPFEKVVDAVVKDRDMSRSPLFQVMFSLQNTPEVPELKLGGLQLSAAGQKATTAKFDIAFMMNESSTGIYGAVEYSTDLYKAETIGQMVSHYMALLESVARSAAKQIGSLSMLTASEETTLLHDFNATSLAYAKEKNIVSRFETQAAKSPEAPAVIFEKEQLSYAALNERSNQLANYLIKQGVKAETLVPVCIERSIEMVIGILAILKAGGAYVPIDPEYPQDRITYMLEDTGAKLVITNSTVSNKIPKVTNLEIIELDKDKATLRKQSTANPATDHEPQNLAYVIYTSGSTGRPKGVQIEHRSANAFIAWCQSEFSKSKFDIVYATTSICFDLSVFELFYPLSIGKPIRILENGLAIPNYLATDTAVLINTVPSVVESLLNEKTDLGRISVINMAGEPIPSSVSARLDMNHTEVRNLYGPTEDTTYSTIFRLEQGKPVLIGKPIANTRIYIINQDNALAPIGVSGEIYIGGAGLARGYLNKSELTQEKFIKDPFSEEADGRIYRTGDLGRWLPDGNIEYQGRIDDQIKIRGFRIELGEIESVLSQSDLVTQSVVLAKEDSKGTKRLVGYVVSNQKEFDKQVIQKYLSTKLPEYMVPSLWVELSAIPLTPNGKTDRKALPDPELTDMAVEYVAPRNEMEQKLAAIWKELLNVDRVGIHDNFFELGGHSLLAMRLVSYIERDLSVSIPINILFQFRSINDLSKYIEFELQATGSNDERNDDEFDVLDI